MKSKTFTTTPNGAHSKIWSPKTTTATLVRGFTLVETLLALFILTTAIVAGLSVVNQGLSSTQVAKSKLIAANLTQEGIEVVRNIRDNNWLEQRTTPELLWDDGLSSGDWEATHQSQSLEPYQGRFLKNDNNGFYNYTSGPDTKFKRKITIQKITNDQLRVISKVEWQERGKIYNLTAVGDLYNWLRGTTPSPPTPPPPPPPPPVVCEGAPNTDWGANLYNCIGSNKRCYNGSCVTCGGTMNAGYCWYLGGSWTTHTDTCANRGGVYKGTCDWVNDPIDCSTCYTVYYTPYAGCGGADERGPWYHHSGASASRYCLYHRDGYNYCNSLPYDPPNNLNNQYYYPISACNK